MVKTEDRVRLPALFPLSASTCIPYFLVLPRLSWVPGEGSDSGDGRRPKVALHGFRSRKAKGRKGDLILR